jgi:hypothetical protein
LFTISFFVAERLPTAIHTARDGFLFTRHFATTNLKGGLRRAVSGIFREELLCKRVV